MWADNVGIKKISLTVVETNIKAINLYKKYGFIEEGVLRNDRLHKDGSYYNTIIMGRFLEEDKKQMYLYSLKISFSREFEIYLLYKKQINTD